jgi:ATP-dependent helicase/DNAse subunit B
VDLGQGGKVRVPSRADRIDKGRESLRVIDYKSGGQLSQLQETVRESIKTAFQLPVYLAALARETGEERSQAVFLLIRDQKATQGLAWSPERSKELEERIRELARGMLAGMFVPRPERVEDCDRRCGLKTLCRHEPPPGQAGEGS